MRTSWPQLSHDCATWGAALANELEDLAAEADRETPQLVVRDKRGEPYNDVAPSRAYRDLERILYGEYGLVAMAMRPGVISPDRASSLVFNDAFIFLASQAESGLFCPLGMTRAMARTLKKFASEADPSATICQDCSRPT